MHIDGNMQIVMKKNILKLLLILILLAGTGKSTFAQTSASRSGSATVQARVGDIYLNLSGYVSPYASIVLTYTNNAFLGSAVADRYGNFSFSQIKIDRGFTGYCLTAVDFKRVGESTVCVSFAPSYVSVTNNDLFLPPTQALLAKEIKVGGLAVVFGYTMPGALVTIHLSNGRTINVQADSAGYYRYEIADLKVGIYKLYSSAGYNNKISLNPTKQMDIKVTSTITTEEKIKEITKQIRRKLELATPEAELEGGGKLAGLPVFSSIYFWLISLIGLLLILLLLFLYLKKRKKEEPDLEDFKGLNS